MAMAQFPVGVVLTVATRATAEGGSSSDVGASACEAFLTDGMKVTVRYSGRIVECDDSGLAWGVFDHADSFDFELGAGTVVPGWDVAFRCLRVGDTATLRLSPEHAYGAVGIPNPHGPPQIPPNATLEFDISVLSATMLNSGERALSSAGLLKDGRADVAMHVGERKGLDGLGPMVLQSDGSYKRCANWIELTAVEKERTLRVVAKRNATRAKKLQRQRAAGKGRAS